ncbi:aminotransferase class III-fold pyridoxal phosphate-dependent enzyme, partial [Rhizobium sp. KVB221]|nr:aminotransferase class III-fold pyridoxal phosphate-dependent enzyme [Rhizobium setariae]
MRMDDLKQDAVAIATILRELYGIEGKVSPLPGEQDLNFRVEAEDRQRFLLKLHAPGDDQSLDMQVAVLDHLNRVAPELRISRQLPSRAGAILTPVDHGGDRKARLLTWIDGDVWAKAKNRGPASATSLGTLLGHLDLALKGFAHPGARRIYGWDLAQAEMHLANVPLIEDTEKRSLVAAILNRFSTVIRPALEACPRQVIHNDANDYNTILDAEGRVSGLLDFGDMVETHRVVEIAVAGAYALIGETDPVGSVARIAEAYHAVNPLTEEEANILFDLVKLRYAVSILMAAKQIREQPDNQYLLVSQEDVWRELKRLEGENASMARMRIRDACGFAAVSAAAQVAAWLEREAHSFAPVIRPNLSRPQVTVFDFSATSPDATLLDSLDGPGFDRYCEERIATEGADFGVGAYGEDRTIYKGDAFGTTAPHVRRTVHIGIDIFAPAGEPVHAPMAGTVAFIHDDAVAYGFGPTVLLQHETDHGDVFWTLYGHLSRASVARLRVGQPIAKGAAFTEFGPRPENGEWPPHLHFQIVTDHLGLGARMHGVGTLAEWQIWQQVSPDPSVVLGLPISATRLPPRDKAFLVRERLRSIGRSLSIAYAPEPLKIVAAEGCHLIDETGTRWLDMVNNVCHVGHCHPRVVKAAEQQLAALNTNSRYLHDGLVEYARRLSALFPDPLSVCFF